MTENKHIYVDDVDVSGCRYLFDDTSYKRSKTSCSITLKDCKYLGDNCYFKQLARKTQECEELKRLVAKQKNAKIQLSKLKDKQYKEFCDMKQILIEIKEIVETENNDIKVLYNRRTYQRMKQILQIINEVE